jgi:hypothetical protein
VLPVKGALYPIPKAKAGTMINKHPCTVTEGEAKMLDSTLSNGNNITALNITPNIKNGVNYYSRMPVAVPLGVFNMPVAKANLDGYHMPIKRINVSKPTIDRFEYQVTP